MKLRLPAPRPLSRLAAALWALVIPLMAWLPLLLLLGLFYALNELATWLLFPACMGAWALDEGWRSGMCRGARWLATWWWALAGILSIPACLASYVWLVRRVALPGYRLRLVGFLVWMEVVSWVGAEAIQDATVKGGEFGAPQLAYLALWLALLATGLWLAFRSLRKEDDQIRGFPGAHAGRGGGRRDSEL